MKDNSRKATKAELLLISFLVKKANLILNDNWQEDLTVSPMDDGGMGSLILDLDSDTDAKRTMGSQASERTFISKTKPHDRTPKVRSLNEHGKIVTVYGPPPTGNYQK